MTVNQQTCFTVTCDGCHKHFEHDYEPHWPSATEAIGHALDSGEWWGDENLLLCDDCKLEPHAFLPQAGTPSYCARCPHPAEEHEPSPIS